MKKIISAILAISILLASCGESTLSTNDPGIEEPQSLLLIEIPDESNDQEENDIAQEPFEGRIAIVTGPPEWGWVGHLVADQMIEKYGEDKIIRRYWPVLFAQEEELMAQIIEELGSDPAIRAIIIGDAVLNTNAAFEQLRRTRDDIFVVFCVLGGGESSYDMAQIADLVLRKDEVRIGEAIILQAQNLGAENFIHYSFPRHMNIPLLAARRDVMREAAERSGINFIELNAPDLMSDGMLIAQTFLSQDIPRQIELYGVDTAIFGTQCGIQDQIIQQVIKTGAIFPSPCDPSPYHGFPTALGITPYFPSGEYNERGEEVMRLKITSEVVNAIMTSLSDKNMTGRLSTWPVQHETMLTYVGVEYAIKWINGDVPKEGIDVDVLRSLMEDYAGVNVTLTPFTDEFPYVEEGTGETFDNFLMVLMDFITF